MELYISPDLLPPDSMDQGLEYPVRCRFYGPAIGAACGDCGVCGDCVHVIELSLAVYASGPRRQHRRCTTWQLVTPLAAGGARPRGRHSPISKLRIWLEARGLRMPHYGAPLTREEVG